MLIGATEGVKGCLRMISFVPWEKKKISSRLMRKLWGWVLLTFPRSRGEGQGEEANSSALDKDDQGVGWCLGGAASLSPFTLGSS